MIKEIHHIAIAVNNLDDALKSYEELFGLKPEKTTTSDEQGVKAALLPIGKGAEIELLQPIDPNGGVAKFLEKKGEGIHHIAIEVENIEQELEALAAKGVQLIDKEPRSGIDGRIAFMHPKSTRGVLIELVQKV